MIEPEPFCALENSHAPASPWALDFHRRMVLLSLTGLGTRCFRPAPITLTGSHWFGSGERGRTPWGRPVMVMGF